MKSYSRKEIGLLLVSVFIIALCGILYELLIGTLSSYFLGSSVLHFSITIGLFMSFMGIGSWVSKYVQEPLLDNFIRIELILGFVGGMSAITMYASFSLTENFYLVAFFLIAILGTCIGLEIPILARIIQKDYQFKDTIAEVLSFDYIGALLASILFPLFFLPYFGTVRTSFLIGLLNIGVAITNLNAFKDKVHNFRKLSVSTWSIFLLLILGFFTSFYSIRFLEAFLYRDEIIYTEQSSYQRIVITKWNQDIRLFLNGNLQFSSVDEYRYHEPLVHLPVLFTNNKEKVLLLGAGDGLAVTELLKYDDIREIHLVDLDPSMTNLGKNHPIIKKLNRNALNHPKVKIFHQDAWEFIRNSSDVYDVIIADLPDPNDTGLGKLYSKEFYEQCSKRVSAQGIFVTQATSPYFTLRSFWCIHKTLESVFPSVFPFHVYVPTFGDWGFVAATKPKLSTQQFLTKIQEQMQKTQFEFRFLKSEELSTLFYFGKDCDSLPSPIQTLDSQVLVDMYEKEWHQWHN